jgi:hypothetical protein
MSYMQDYWLKTQAHSPDDLLQHLLAQYKAAVSSFESEGSKGELTAGAAQFIEFAREYLNVNRPRTTFVADDNIGVVLSNGDRLIVAPYNPESIQGTMAPITGRAVDDGLSTEISSRTYTDQGAIPISGFARKPKHSINYAETHQGKALIDKTAKTTTKRYDTKAPVVDDPLNR